MQRLVGKIALVFFHGRLPGQLSDQRGVIE